MDLHKRSLSPILILRAVFLTLFIASMSVALHSGGSFADGNFAQKTDQEAGCTYGTKPLADWKIPAPGSYKTVQQGRGAGIDPNDPCYVFLYWTSEVGPSSSFSAAMVNDDPFFNGKSTLCKSASDPACQPSAVPNGQFRHLGGFYKCESNSDLNCVSSVSVTLANGTQVDATFESHFPDVPMIPASDSPLISYPKSGPPTLWSYQSGGVKRMLYLQGVIERSWASRNGTWAGPFGTLNFAIIPVELKTGVKEAEKPALREVTFTSPDGRTGSRIEFSTEVRRGYGADCGNEWIAVDTGACLNQQEFPEGERYRVALHVAKDTSFFLNGRLDAPIAYTEDLGAGKRLIIEGAPATLFAVSGSIPKSVLDAKAVAAIRAARDDFPRSLGFAPTDLPPMETRYPDLLSDLLPYFGDRTTFNLKAWTLRSSGNLGRFSPACYEKSRGEILGIISTNATAFIGDPPTLDPSTNTLGYKVAAPHYGPDGKTENLGRYYMNMNSNFTQCILGIDRVPDEASVGITYGQGREVVSTVSVKQDKDWLRLQANNFTYSAPEIKVSFKRPAVSPSGSGASAGGSSNPSGTASSTTPSTSNRTPAKGKSITCIKGGKKKVVSATNPKCPAGWKKSSK